MDSLVEVSDLWVDYRTPQAYVEALGGVSLEIMRNEFVGLVGESGSGKTTLGNAILRLLPADARVKGRVVFDGKNLFELSEAKMRDIRGKRITAVFQDPYTSLNPLYRVGDQVSRPLEVHYGVSKSEAKRRIGEFLKLVGLSDSQYVLSAYPYELSGGTQQRVMLAMALSTLPQLIIADEPTTSVDASIQAQIVRLLAKLKNELRFSMLLITHNIEVAATICDRLAVMYAGRIVELGPTHRVLASPRHPYTKALLRSVPKIRLSSGEPKRIEALGGAPPDPLRPPTGCRFHPRCPYALEQCSKVEPNPSVFADGVAVWCHQYG
ncbi:MAG: ABC transporter ATP-binding protein [Thermoprotei archaeon]